MTPEPSDNQTSEAFSWRTDSIDSLWSTGLVGLVMSSIMMVGLIGNILSVLVWVKGRRRKTSTAKFLSALAIADILVLCSGGLEFWIFHVLYLDIRLSGDFVCKLFFYVPYVGPSISAWVLVSVTIERTLSMVIPHKIKLVCRPATALIVIVLTVLAILVIYSPFLVGVELMTFTTNTSSWTECIKLPESILHKYWLTWQYVDMCLFFIIPFTIIMICNSVIMVKVFINMKKHKKSLQARGHCLSGPTKAEKVLRIVTVRIIMLCVTFCLCTGPISILNTITISQIVSEINEDRQEYLRMLFHLLMYLNNGINFFLYCFIGSGFRKDLRALFRLTNRSSS